MPKPLERFLRGCLFIALVTGLVLPPAWAVQATSGDIDLSFNQPNGYVVLNSSPIVTDVQKIIVQPDTGGGEKIVAASDNSAGWKVARYTSSGALDPTFGSGGVVTIDLGPDTEALADMVQLLDGRLVLGGTYGLGSSSDFALAVLSKDGVLDTTFNPGVGYKKYDIMESLLPEEIHALGIQNFGSGDYRIIAGGSYGNSPGNDVLARFTMDGTLDGTFGYSGCAFLADIYPTSNVLALTVLSDNQIVAGGTFYDGSRDQFMVGELTNNGFLNTNFDGDGIKIVDLGTNERVEDLALQPDGSVVAVGSATIGGLTRMVVARFYTTFPVGQLDTSFSGDGLITDALNPSNAEQALAVALQPDGKILVGGTSGSSLAIVRYTSAGVLDTTFSGDGVVFSNPLDPTAKAYTLAIQGDGKILAGGTTSSGMYYGLIARYLGVDNTAPAIASVSIPNTTMHVGSTVTATITVGLDPDSYHLVSGSIGGFALSDLQKMNNSTYSATFTVADGGTDRAAEEDIPVSLVLADGANNENAAYTTPISQDSDLIDAHRPVVNGGLANQAFADNASSAPFSSVVVADSGSPSLTVMVTIQNGGNRGDFTDASRAGWTRTPLNPDIIYTRTFSSGADLAGQAQASIRALVFAPRQNAIAPGASERTDFSLVVNDGGGAVLHTGAISVVTTSVNDAPQISGAAANQPVNDNASVQVFSGLEIREPDYQAATVTVTIANGVNRGDFYAGSAAGWTRSLSDVDIVYTRVFSVQANVGAAVQAAVRALIFEPRSDAIPAWTSETTTFTVQVDDGLADPVVNPTTISAVTTSLNNAPGIYLERVPALPAARQSQTQAPTAGSVTGAWAVNGVYASNAYLDPDYGQQPGLAVTGRGGEGTWWYSLDDGASWSVIAGVSPTNALLIPASETALWYYQNAEGFHGEISPALTFRAWDGSTGMAGANADASTNGETTAFSVAVANLALTVDDDVAPVVTGVSAPAGVYRAGQNVDFQVEFSEDVSVDTSGGGLSLLVNLDQGGQVQAPYLSHTPANTLTFRYQVAADQMDADGISLDGLIQTTGGAIRDDQGNLANLSLAGHTSFAGVRVDTLAPAAPAITLPVDGAMLTDTTPTLQGTAEASSHVTVTIDGSVADQVSANELGQWAYTPPLALDQGSHTLSAVAADAAGNNSPTSAVITITVDSVAPAAPVLVTPANGSRVATRRPTFTGTGEPNNQVTVSLDSVAAGTVTVDGAGNWALALGYDLAEGSHVFRAQAKDQANNIGPAAEFAFFTVDVTAPGVVLSSAAPAYTNAASISVTVTFLEEVSGFTADDVTLNNASLSNFSGSGMVYSFDLIASLEGEFGASIAAGACTDLAGNSNPSAALSRVYDMTLPRLIDITRAGASPTATESVDFVVTFDEAVQGVDASDFGLVVEGVSGAALESITGSGSAYTLRVSTGTGSGSIRLNMIGDGTVADRAGNLLNTSTWEAGTYIYGMNYLIDRDAPGADLPVTPSVPPVESDPFLFTVQYRDNTGLDLDTLDDGDVRVSGPGFDQLATFVRIESAPKDVSTAAGSADLNVLVTNTYRVVYQINPPEGSWAHLQNGEYTITLIAGEVLDVAGNALPVQDLGTFEVQNGYSLILPMIFFNTNYGSR